MANSANTLARGQQGGGQKFSRGKSVKYGNWRGRNWSGRNWGRNWSGRNWNGGNWGGNWGYYGFSGGPFISIGGFGYPYYRGWYPSAGWSISWGWTPPGAGAFLTRLATGIVLMTIILRTGYDYGYSYTGIGIPIGPGAFPTRLTTTIILTGIILRMGTIMVTTATVATDTAIDLRLPNCKPDSPELVTTMVRSMG